MKATYFTASRPVYELHDLDADPSELNNASGQGDFATIDRELREALAQKMILDGDFLPLPALPDEDAPFARRNAAQRGKKADR